MQKDHANFTNAVYVSYVFWLDRLPYQASSGVPLQEPSRQKCIPYMLPPNNSLSRSHCPTETRQVPPTKKCSGKINPFSMTCFALWMFSFIISQHDHCLTPGSRSHLDEQSSVHRGAVAQRRAEQGARINQMMTISWGAGLWSRSRGWDSSGALQLFPGLAWMTGP